MPGIPGGMDGVSGCPGAGVSAMIFKPLQGGRIGWESISFNARRAVRLRAATKKRNIERVQNVVRTSPTIRARLNHEFGNHDPRSRRDPPLGGRARRTSIRGAYRPRTRRNPPLRLRRGRRETGRDLMGRVLPGVRRQQAAVPASG
jgi:hypothetical protein